MCFSVALSALRVSVAAQSSDTKVTGPVPGPSVLHADVTLNKTAEIPLVSASLLYDQKSAALIQSVC